MAEKDGKIQGIRLSKDGLAVHHLLFADDSVLMCRAEENESAAVVECLRLYGEASG